MDSSTNNASPTADAKDSLPNQSLGKIGRRPSAMELWYRFGISDEGEEEWEEDQARRLEERRLAVEEAVRLEAQRVREEDKKKVFGWNGLEISQIWPAESPQRIAKETNDDFLKSKKISSNRRTRATPYSRRVKEAGCKSYTVYNHMLLPVVFDTPEKDYWHLVQHVQVWDVAAERQVELVGPDAAQLAQLMTPRDLSKFKILQCKYGPVCNADGFILNDPIIIKLAEDRFWMSVADSDIKFFAQGLASGYGLDVKVFEPDVNPLAVQGPKADDLMARVFGEQVRNIRFFRGKMLTFRGVEMYVARSGWSKQGGFEIYMPEWSLGEALWDELFAHGEDLNVRAGGPQGNERMESGLLSFGNDMDEFDTPFECGLDTYLNLDADIASLSLPALKAMKAAGNQTRKLVGLTFDIPPNMQQSRLGGSDIEIDGVIIGEIRSQAWSFRYKKHLAIAMLPISYIDANDGLTIDGQTSEFHPIPFKFDLLPSFAL